MERIGRMDWRMAAGNEAQRKQCILFKNQCTTISLKQFFSDENVYVWYEAGSQAFNNYGKYGVLWGGDARLDLILFE